MAWYLRTFQDSWSSRRALPLSSALFWESPPFLVSLKLNSPQPFLEDIANVPVLPCPSAVLLLVQDTNVPPMSGYWWEESRKLGNSNNSKDDNAIALPLSFLLRQDAWKSSLLPEIINAKITNTMNNIHVSAPNHGHQMQGVTSDQSDRTVSARRS